MSFLDDTPIERRHSDSNKWAKFADGNRDVIGAWVADMDFPTCEKIIDAIRARVDERVFGYSVEPDGFYDVIMHRLEQKYGWQTEREWFVVQPGVVPSLYFASHCTGSPGDAVMAARPNYHFFLETTDATDRCFQPIDCSIADGRWQMDFDQMRQDISPRTSTFLLCNPFNPLGRVLDRQELETVADLCLANNTLICSDEIHADLILDEDKRHVPIATLGREVAQQSITLISASKAFNLPGIGGLSLAIIPDPKIREAFEARAYGVATHPGALAYAATMTAFKDCDGWLQDVIRYLRGNRDYLAAEIDAIDSLSMTHVEGTFLAWIDVSHSGLEKPTEAFLAGGVALSDGEIMGSTRHVRLNFACHRQTLEEIVRRLRATLGV